MNFHFEKIGPIDSADLELGDFTLIAGRNNTGKTYIVYTMYGFLKMWQHFVDPKRLRPQGTSSTTFPDRLSEFLQGPAGCKQIFTWEELAGFRDRVLKQASLEFSERGISRVFSTSRENFSGSSLSAGKRGRFPVNEIVEYEYRGGGKITWIHNEDGANLELLHAVNDPARTPEDPFWLAIRIAFPDMPDPFILSAERFGIALFYKELDFTKNRLVEMLQQLGDAKQQDREIPFLFMDRLASRYALPVKDNIDHTRHIPELRDSRGVLYDEKLHDRIKDLMGGYYATSGDDIRFKSRAGKGRSFDIPLHLASSSARGLSDLYFYLRHRASPWSHLLIIDEPESHLDTFNQIRLARNLAHFVRSGIKVLVTTHSDYLIKEINNLIMLGHLDGGRNKRLPRDLGYKPNDRLDIDSVRAYVAEDDGLTPCKVDRYGIEIPLFDKTIDDINHVSNELAAAISTTE